MEILAAQFVRKKLDFYDAYMRGEFGNMVQHWESFTEWQADGAPTPVGVRSTQPSTRKHLMNCSDIGVIWERCTELGLGSYRIGRATPDHMITMQGELVRCPDWALFASFEPVTMRIALRSAQQFCGLRARALLKHHMWPDDYESFSDLVDAYPNAAIEFTCYRIAVGTIPNRNTVIWEVREY